MAALAVAAVLLVANGPAQAGLMLTPAGVADGFTLSTYASGGGASTYEFIAAAPVSSANLAVVDFQNGFLRLYPDVNGQTPASALSSQALSGVVNIANAGGKTYAAVQGGGFSQVSSSLALTPVSVPNYAHDLGLAGNPVTGHLLAAGSLSGVAGLYDINPLTGASTLINAAFRYDGVSVSPDGTTVYAELNGHVVAYNIATHAVVFDFTSSHGPDGTGAISGGPFNGFVIVNNNDGTVSLLNPTGTIETIIASGGSRGDFTSPDTNTGTLLLSEFGSSFRLGAPGGGTFGAPPGPAVPEPTSIALFGLMAVGGAVYRWRRRKPMAAA
jgi:hypothetical protein